MFSKLLPATAVALLALAGCATDSSGISVRTTEPTGTSPSRNDAQVCDAELARDIVGQKVSPQLVAEARKRTGAETARALRPNDVITMEYNPQRLNVKVDEQDVIISLNCS